MINKLFGKSSSNTHSVYCEITGDETALDNTVVLTKIDGVIALNNFNNPSIDFDNKIIKPIDKPPINFYSEIFVPEELKPIVGGIFSIVNDEDDIEQSTAIMSQKGQDVFSGQKLLPFFEHISNGVELLQIPSTMFFAIIDTIEAGKDKKCKNWDVNYKGIGRKYMCKSIHKELKENQTFGMPGILKPGFNVAVSDCSQKNPNGTGYLYKTDGTFNPIDLCCNESAVSFCIKNQALVYYNDFLKDGKLRILTPETERINRNLQNPHLFRSSNI